ncbi:MAG TPA: peptidase M19 [Desulfosporosinus sp.]|nr:peptidase M19 [Desulfosporosinus sp.]
MNKSLYEDSIVIDAACPLADEKGKYKLWMDGGVTAICPTVAMEENTIKTKQKMSEWIQEIEANEALLLHVKSVEDIYKAKAENKLGIIMHFQNTKPIGQDITLIPEFHKMGLRMVQLCYNVKNYVGYGCTEKVDKGLSSFGEKAIKEMERVGIIVDVTHTGYRTTMEAIEVLKKPPVCSHSNVYKLCESDRNLKDDQIKAIAKKGGVIGLNGFPPFVAKKDRPTVEDLLDHADYMIKLVGIDHIALGIDYWQGMAGIASLPKAWIIYLYLVLQGRWSPKAYPPPPWNQPVGIETPTKLSNIVEPMLKRGYSHENIKKVLGENWLRVFKEVW